MPPYFAIFLVLVTKCSIEIKCKEFNPDYKLALKYSMLFIEAQRSGKLPENNRIPWRGDSALHDKGDNGEDLSGGYYDGSDFVKFGYTTAYSTTMLSWGLQVYPEIYKSVGEYNAMLDAIKWATDFFIKCHVSKNELYGQIGDFETDHKFWGRPEDMNMSRPAYKINETHPGSDLAGEVSAALSSASIAFKDVNPQYARELLNHSIDLYVFASNFRGLMRNSLPVSRQYYNELYSYGEQLVWASVWLYKATRDLVYLSYAEDFFEEFLLRSKNSTYFFYNEKSAGIRLLLGQLFDDNLDFRGHRKFVKTFCDFAIDVAPKTTKGALFVRQYGALPLAANVAFICSEAAKINGFPRDKYENFLKIQIDYILGSTGPSYVVGYGEDYPKKPYHSASSCPNPPKPCDWFQYNSTEPNPQIVYGALVSGPNATDYHIDEREDAYFEYNVVSLDFNVGFQNCLAALIHFVNQRESITEVPAVLDIVKNQSIVHSQ